MAERRSTVEQVLVNCLETVECLALTTHRMTHYQSLVDLYSSFRPTECQRGMYQHKVDLDMLNAAKIKLADVSSVSPSSDIMYFRVLSVFSLKKIDINSEMYRMWQV